MNWNGINTAVNLCSKIIYPGSSSIKSIKKRIRTQSKYIDSIIRIKKIKSKLNNQSLKICNKFENKILREFFKFSIF